MNDKEKLIKMLHGALFGLALCLIVLAFAACNVCTYGEAACHGSTVVLCNADERWEDVIDCYDLEPGEWVCVEHDEMEFTAICEEVE
jgi:hypothetical protein